jgi:hypothetical protein
MFLRIIVTENFGFKYSLRAYAWKETDLESK